MVRLLLVDDEPVILEDLAAFLGDMPGIENIHTAGSGLEAVEKIEQHPFDIIVTDIRMPGMSGLELCEYTRENWKMTECILLSGYAEFEYAQKALQTKAAAYLLKPVKKDELLDTIVQVAETVQGKWRDIGSRRKTEQTLRSHLSLLRANFLRELLRGERMAREKLIEELDKFELPFTIGGQTAMMLLRVENRFLEYDEQSILLFEFAVINIAEEVFGEYFDIWTCKDEFQYLTFLMKMKPAVPEPVSGKKLLERLACQLQIHVSTYLGGKVSALVCDFEPFPERLAELYQKSLQLLRRLPVSEQEHLIRLWDQPPQTPVRSLQRLYEPPTVLQLMEAGRWQEADDRLAYVFAELSEQGLDTSEHLTEVFFALSNAFSCIVHMNGLQLADVSVSEEYAGMNRPMLRSANQLHGWSSRMLRRIEARLVSEMKQTHGTFVQQVHRYIERHLSEDVSLQALGGHMQLHPAYISAMYKQETGENVSEYIYRYRMEKARYLLKNSKAKVYEIAAQLGYQYTPYFTKLFKSHFGMTPQEYRECIAP
ncbi:response regulator [Paenibacillus thalictri]|uniref:Response regulator n=1 Tax=Paenibacillus thalictri TaxID=2527873 RepID=A0A4Q9DI61_9BACL|nr:response regulator [Paenibacillus thalictri]TBL70766.1 response regulator [Paenibacillus thalictri]